MDWLVHSIFLLEISMTFSNVTLRWDIPCTYTQCRTWWTSPVSSQPLCKRGEDSNEYPHWRLKILLQEPLHSYIKILILYEIVLSNNRFIYEPKESSLRLSEMPKPLLRLAPDLTPHTAEALSQRIYTNQNQEFFFFFGYFKIMVA